MDHHDHENLLRNGITKAGGVWADFGSGRGAFTLALAELVGSTGEIYSIDKNRGALRQQERSMAGHFPNVTTHFINAALDIEAILFGLCGSGQLWRWRSPGRGWGEVASRVLAPSG